MAKQVRQTKAGQAISAWVVLKGTRQVATMHAHHGQSAVTVDCYQSDRAAERSARNAGRPNPAEFTYQQGTAGGSGYDLETAAMAGIWVDGHYLADHSELNRTTDRWLSKYHQEAVTPQDGLSIRDRWQEKVSRAGFEFANWDGSRKVWRSLFFVPGLDRLKRKGYTVIRVI